MQMETPARNHCMSVGMTDIGRLTVSSASDNRMTWNSHMLLMGAWNDTRKVSERSWKVKHVLTILSRHFTARSLPKEITRCANTYRDVHRSVFVRSETQRQPECPMAGEWMNKPQRLSSGLLLGNEENELLTYSVTHSNLNPRLQQTRDYSIPLLGNSRKWKLTLVMQRRPVAVWGWERGCQERHLGELLDMFSVLNVVMFPHLLQVSELVKIYS
jgi:hypothetical protein